jgi:hypothetical protein
MSTRELFFNVGGDPRDDQPVLQPDIPTGHPPIPLTFLPGATPPNRARVDVPEVCTGAATVYYQQRAKAFRVILPPLGQQFQAEAGEPPQLPPEYNGDPDMVAMHYTPVVVYRRGLVRFLGRAWVDDGGPFYPLGDSMLYALGHYHRGGGLRDLVQENAHYLAGHRHDYVRWLGDVNWANDQHIDPTWIDYDRNAADLIDFLYDQCGLRSKITVTGGGMGNARLAAQKLLPVIQDGRQHKVLLAEAVNEQNDSSTNAIWIAQHLRSAGIPVATGRGNSGIQQIRDDGNTAGSSVDCFHTERGLGDANEPGGRHARQVRQVWDFKEFSRPLENAEPPGPESSVATLDDPFKLALFAAATRICGAGAFCFHQGSGVYGHDYQSNYGYRYARFAQRPDQDRLMRAVRAADARLPRGVENWQKFNGGYGGPLIVDVSRGSVNKNYGSRSGGAFCQVVIGADGPVTLKAAQPCTLAVSNPETNETLFEGSVGAGESVALPLLWGYVLVGQIGA